MIKGLPKTLVYGYSTEVQYQATSTTDDKVIYTFRIINETTLEEKKVQVSAASGATLTYDLGSHLFKGYNKIYTWVEDISGHQTSPLTQTGIQAIELDLQPSGKFIPGEVKTGVFSFWCVPIGNSSNKKLTVWIDPEQDGAVYEVKNVQENNKDLQVEITEPLSHGVHTIKAILTYNPDDELLKVSTEPLMFEIAVEEPGNDTPIIWFGNNPTEIVEHDKLSIYYKVYTPGAIKSEVRLYTNQLEIPTSPYIATYDQNNLDWEEWQVTDYELGNNIFTLTCGKQKRSVEVKVKEDSLRDLNILKNGLYLNLDSKGRSNKEN
jgi:hypothetical protein